MQCKTVLLLVFHPSQLELGRGMGERDNLGKNIRHSALHIDQPDPGAVHLAKVAAL